MNTISTSQATSLVRLQELLPQLFQANRLGGRSYLRFSLTEELRLLVPMQYVHESLIVPAKQITALPNMPGPVMGLMSTREQVFCLIDFPLLLGYRTGIRVLRTYHVIVVHLSEHLPSGEAHDPVLLGLAVNKIQGVSRFGDEQLQGLDSQVPLHLKPYVIGSSLLDGQVAYVINPQSILQANALRQ